MLATQSAAPASTPLVGKKELAERLGWSRPTLDRRIDQDRNFPVAMRGNQQGGWGFDLDEVKAYLGDGQAVFAAPAAEPVIEPEPAIAAASARVEHQGEATARQRRDTMQAALFEDRLRRQRGELVEVEPLKMKLGTAVAKLSASLNGLPDTLGRRLRLPENAIAVVRQEVEDTRRALFAELRDLLTDA